MKPRPPLPTRDGVSPSYIWLPEGQWEYALAFLCQHFPEITEAIWLKRFAKQEVRSGNGDILHAHSKVKRGMCIYYYRELEEETPIPFEADILYQDEHLLVADKPHFLAVTPGGRFLKECLLARLKQSTGIDTLSPLHRLDRETAGVILFSKQTQSRGLYQQLFQEKRIEKIYHAIAPSLNQIRFPYHYRSRIVESEQFFVMKETDGAANSETVIELLAANDQLSLYQLHPISGKKHQLRLHMASLGAPILHDLFYPRPQASGADDFQRPLQLLAKHIAFQDPLSGEMRAFSSKRQLLWESAALNA